MIRGHLHKILYTLSPDALDPDPHQQSFGTDHAGNPAADTSSGRVSGWQFSDHALCCPAQAHCRNEVGNSEISPIDELYRDQKEQLIA